MPPFDNYHRKIKNQIIDLVDKAHIQTSHIKFDNLLKEFWSCQFEEKHDTNNLNLIIDNFINSDHFQQEKIWMYKEIGKQLIGIKKSNPKVFKEYDNTIDLVKYVIKVKSNIGKQYWKQVIEKIQDYITRFSDGNDFRMQSGDKLYILALNQIQYDLMQLENIFLTKLAQNYLDYKTTQNI